MDGEHKLPPGAMITHMAGGFERIVFKGTPQEAEQYKKFGILSRLQGLNKARSISQWAIVLDPTRFHCE